jgi:hypothetical protein
MADHLSERAARHGARAAARSLRHGERQYAMRARTLRRAMDAPDAPPETGTDEVRIGLRGAR